MHLRTRLEELVGVSGAEFLMNRPPDEWSAPLTTPLSATPTPANPAQIAIARGRSRGGKAYINARRTNPSNIGTVNASSPWRGA